MDLANGFEKEALVILSTGNQLLKILFNQVRVGGQKSVVHGSEVLDRVLGRQSLAWGSENCGELGNLLNEFDNFCLGAETAHGLKRS